LEVEGTAVGGSGGLGLELEVIGAGRGTWSLRFEYWQLAF